MVKSLPRDKEVPGLIFSSAMGFFTSGELSYVLKWALISFGEVKDITHNSEI